MHSSYSYSQTFFPKFGKAFANSAPLGSYNPMSDPPSSAASAGLTNDLCPFFFQYVDEAIYDGADLKPGTQRHPRSVMQQLQHQMAEDLFFGFFFLRVPVNHLSTDFVVWSAD